MKLHARAASIFIVVAGAWSSLAFADVLATMANFRQLCGANVAALGRVLFPPMPEGNPLPPSPIAEISPTILERYSATPHGAQVELELTNGDIVSGVAVDVGFQSVRLHDGGESRTVRFCDVSTVTVIARNPTLLPPVVEELKKTTAAEERRRRYLRFQELSEAHWAALAKEFGTELERFRAGGWRDRRAAVASAAADVDRTIVTLTKAKRIGIHFNMHGGVGHEYVRGGGIRATSGDANTLGMLVTLSQGAVNPGADNFPPTVFYYARNAEDGLGPWIAQQGAARSTDKTIGTYVMIFDVDAALATGRAVPYRNDSEVALRFVNGGGGFVGVAYEELLLPPLLVQTDVPRRVGIDGLSQQEQALASLLHLKALLSDRRVEALLPGSRRSE